MGPENDNPAAAAQRISAEQHDEVSYTTVYFTKNQEDPVYSNVTLAQRNKQKKEMEKEDVVYTGVDYSSVTLGWVFYFLFNFLKVCSACIMCTLTNGWR